MAETCNTCKHWQKHKYEKSKWGDCPELKSGDNDKFNFSLNDEKMDMRRWDWDTDLDIETHESFGCIQWEVKRNGID
jgi:hypothetical protein